MRVKEDYYDNLDRITKRFEGMELIPIKRAAEFLGIDDRRLKESKTFPIKKVCGRYFVSAVALARWMS